MVLERRTPAVASTVTSYGSCMIHGEPALGRTSYTCGPAREVSYRGEVISPTNPEKRQHQLWTVSAVNDRSRQQIRALRQKAQ